VSAPGPPVALSDHLALFRAQYPLPLPGEPVRRWKVQIVRSVLGTSLAEAIELVKRMEVDGG